MIYISTYLLDAGHDVDIIDLRVDTEDCLGNYLKRERPLLAGISIMPGNALPRAIELSRLIKNHSPNTKVIWGGSFPSLHQKLCMDIPELDYIVSGDGEETMTELVTEIKEKGGKFDPSQINGLVYRRDGEIEAGSPRKPVDLDYKPIGARQLVYKYMPYYLGPKGYLAINAARGCPFKCSFCYNNLLHQGYKSYRAKSVEKVMEEVDWLTLRYKINKIQFMDDDFLAQRNRGFRLLKAIREKHPHMKFYLVARVDELNKEEFVKKLAEVGCESVFFGVESGSTEQLEQMAKGCSTSDTFDTAKLCKKYGITCVYSFTCGLPEETFDNLYESVETARILHEIDPGSWSVMEIISPILGTPLYNDLEIKQEVPEMVPARWCYFSDWKSAKNKPWIQNQGFYEAYQLAFYFSFSSRGHASESRQLSKFLSSWSRMRLLRKKPRILPEFRLLNFIIKKVVWS